MERESNRGGVNDRISNLPEFLIHQILSYLPPKEAARTTVLSKTWLQSYSTSPILTFNERLFVMFPEFVENRYPFINFVNNTLLRYISLNLRIHKLQIKVFRVDHPPAYSLLDKSLRVAFDNCVQELHIKVKRSVTFSPYTLPSPMFDSPKLLTYLRVDQCKFPQNNSKCNPMSFPFLKTLLVFRAYIDDGMLMKLLSGSPSLEKIVLFLVSGFDKFRVCNLGNLKILEIRSGKGIEIDVEAAPSLHLLKYWGSSRRPCLLKVRSTLQNLKRVELHSMSINGSSLNELVTKAPLLEDVEIEWCDELERINIVSDSLKHVNFRRCKNLVETHIEAPSLLKLEYFGENMLSLSLNNTPQELMTYVYISNFGPDQLNSAWFHQLRELLQSVTRARFSFCLWHLGIKFDTTFDLRQNPLPLEHQTENYMPKMNPSSSLFVVFVNTLFSSSRPTTIDTCSLNPAFVDFMKFLGNELITATRNLNCCSSDETKCWRHYLKDINFDVYENSQIVWQPLDQEALQSDYTFNHNMVRFSLTWYSNSNVQGTTKVNNYIGSCSVKFTKEDLKEIRESITVDDVAGGERAEFLY